MNLKNYILVADKDYVWGFPVFNRVVSYLKINNYHLSGIIWTKPKKMNGSIPSLWYLKIFGFYNFLILSLFSFKIIIFKTTLILSKINYNFLSNKKIPIIEVDSLDDQKLYNFIKNIKCDFVIANTSHIFSKKLINSINKPIINKHSSLLPKCRGMMPFFWTYLKQYEFGVTFHLIDIGIDSGSIIYQKKYNLNKNTSMLKFYSLVFNDYEYMLLKSIENLKSKKIIKNFKKQNEYNYLPTKKDYLLFKSKKGLICSFKDIFLVNLN